MKMNPVGLVAAESGGVDRLAEDVPERLVVVGHDREHDDDEDHAGHVPVGGDRVQQRRDLDVQQVDDERRRPGR